MTTPKILFSQVACVGENSPQSFSNRLGCGNNMMPSKHIGDALAYIGAAFALEAQQARQTVAAETPSATPVVQESAHGVAFSINS